MLHGHFRLTSGLHSPEYLQCALVLQHPDLAAELGWKLAERLASSAGHQIDVVAAPAIGGLIIGHEAARALGARFLFAERNEARSMTFRRGFSIHAGESVAVVEDVITTGGSVREVVELCRSASTRVAAVGSIIDRTGGAVDLGVPRVALATLDVVSYSEDVCPMCLAGVPIEKPGSRPT